MTLPEDLRQLLLAFNEHGVEYLIVGGYAVGTYAEPRATKDLDLFIRSEMANSEAVFRALAVYGAPIAGLTPADFRDDPHSVFQIGQPPARVDILQYIDGVEFDEAWEHRTETAVAGVPAHIISPEHLIQNKLKSGRMRDLADVEAIREAQGDRDAEAESQRQNHPHKPV
jgi:predicted nucleotidyltransferase